MRRIPKLLISRRNNIFADPQFWVVIILLLVIGAFYYSLQFFRVEMFQILPISRELVTIEYVYNIAGSLFYIPILFSIFKFGWKGTLIIWALTIIIILPRILYFYLDNFGRIFFNLFYLSIPVLLISYVGLELNWREKERNQLAEREKERQNYLDQVFKAQEDERSRLAREIHDDSIQRLTAISINAKLLTRSQEPVNIPEIRKGIETIRDMVIGVSKDLRRITLDLRPTVLDDLGLIPAIRWLVNGFKEDSGIVIQMDVVGNIPQLSKKYSVNIFRIVQEALNNIQKHSKATKASVSLAFTDETIKLTISDNGVGFQKPDSNAELTAKGKLGLLGMRQRAQFLNGTVSIQSEVGFGTTLIFQFKALNK